MLIAEIQMEDMYISSEDTLSGCLVMPCILHNTESMLGNIQLLVATALDLPGLG